jgi:magnesium transporter
MNRIASYPRRRGGWEYVSVHGPETAGRLAIRSFPTASPVELVSVILRRLTQEDHEIADLILVIDDAGRYQGVVELKHILRACDNQPVSALMQPNWPIVSPDTDQEHAVAAASKSNVTALPVITREGKPLGVISPRTLLEVLAREHNEDIHRIVGILRERAGAEHALEDSPLRRAGQRLPWLLVGLVMSIVAVGVMASFERALAANVTIAFFIPALVYLADAVGTQTEAIAVRGLSLRKLSLGRILATEAATGCLIGMALAVLAFFGVWLVFGSAVIGFGVGISLFVAGTLASTIGLLLPWLLSRADIDPAFGSGPVATIIQDVLTILVYFVVMTVLLPKLN